MVKLSRKSSFDESDEEDPMAGVANLVDAMLVIAVGLLVFLVISWNMQAIVFNEDVTPEQRQTPDVSNSSGEGYAEMGKVYKDPKTGKMIMIES